MTRFVRPYLVDWGQTGSGRVFLAAWHRRLTQRLLLSESAFRFCSVGQFGFYQGVERGSSLILFLLFFCLFFIYKTHYNCFLCVFIGPSLSFLHSFFLSTFPLSFIPFFIPSSFISLLLSFLSYLLPSILTFSFHIPFSLSSIFLPSMNFHNWSSTSMFRHWCWCSTAPQKDSR